MTISIIIPIYNVAPYVEQCLQSVASQICQGDMECLLIDDCGTDESMDICERFIASYNGPISFRIIHHEHNRGLSAARNTGIDAAKGEWIFFIDSDDSITPDCIQKMVDAAEQTPDVDMVMGQINVIGADLHWDSFGPPGIHTDGFIEKACTYKIYTMAWNRLLSWKFIVENKLYFVEGLLHEDILWSVQVACKLRKMVAIPEKTYNYLVRENSIQTNKSKAFHQMHLGNVKIALLRTIFDNHLENNKTLFGFVTSDLPQFVCGRIDGSCVVERNFYHLLRKSPYWTLSEMSLFMPIPIGVRILEFHRHLPIPVGFYYYRFCMWVLNHKNR